MSESKDFTPLLQRVKEGDEEALGRILEDFRPLIDSKVAEYSSVLEEDDVKQLASIAIFEAAKSYSPRSGKNRVSFGLYAKICVRNRLISETRKIRPASSPIEDGELADDVSLEEQVMARDAVTSTMAMARKKLTPYEERVLILYLEGNSYADIAAILGTNVKSVGNAMTRVRSKLKNLL